MGIRSNDIRAFVIIVALCGVTGWCYFNTHPTLAMIFGVLDVILSVMFLRIVYLREIKKTYVSRFDKIEIPEEEDDGEAEEA